MIIKTGCDIVSAYRFKKILNTNGQEFLQRIFLSHELEHALSQESLMGIFAAKEAIIKALELPVGSWHTIAINKQTNGKPTAQILDFDYSRVISSDISITHERELACAICCFLLT